MHKTIQEQNIILIIQARMGSTRLPKKMMLDLAGAPLLERILERVKRVRLINKIVVAIPVNEQDDVLEQVTLKCKVECFRGSENDLVDRYYQASKKFRADLILRLPADNPIPEPDEYDSLITYHCQSNNDFSSNIYNFMGNGYPDGIGVEIFTFNSLEYIWKNVNNPYYREHIAINYYDYLNNEPPKHTNFKVGTINCPTEISRPDLVLDVNTQEEYLFIKQLYDYIYPRNPLFKIADVIDWYDNVYNNNKKKEK